MALITGTAKKKPMSILASDLSGNIDFDISQTIPAMDMSSNKYDEGMNLYLQALGVNKIDKVYNETVKQFELQLEEQEMSARLQANVAAESAANMAVEAQPGLGTGASAVASEGRQSALSAVQEGITQSVAQSYQEGMASISEEYQSKLESVLGKYDESTGTFEGLAEYENLSNKTTEAMSKVLALMIDPTADTQSDKYLEILQDAGFIEPSTIPGEVILTTLGQEQIDMLVNSVDVNMPQDSLGGKTLSNMIALQMAMSDYSGYLDDGTSMWSSLSESKRTELVREYESWIYNNQDTLRLTAWDLYTKTDTGFELDTFWQTPVLDVKIEGVDTAGVYISQLTTEQAGNCTNTELSVVKQEISTGKIPDGSYFTFQRGKLYDNAKYYYVKNNTVYETEYTAENPPPVISLESATVRSFGKYFETGTGKGKQDKWVQHIIDYGKAGRLPEGCVINMNYGYGTARWYKYENGEFTKYDDEEDLSAPLSIWGHTYKGYEVIQSSPTGHINTEKYLDWKE